MEAVARAGALSKLINLLVNFYASGSFVSSARAHPGRSAAVSRSDMWRSRAALAGADRRSLPKIVLSVWLLER